MNKVTIGIPIFNVEQYIEKSLTSALNQDFESIDYIVIDGCGGDNSMKIVEQIVSAHPRKDAVRIIKQDSNRGIGDDRNLVIENTETEYLYFLDCDDEMMQDCISTLFNIINADSTIDFVNAQNSIHNGEEEVYTPHKSYHEYQDKHDMFNAYLTSDISGVMWNKLYRVAFLKDNNIRTIHSMISEDVGFSLQEMYYAKKIVVVPAITYLYYRRAGADTLTSKTYRYLPRRSDVLLDMHRIVIEKKMGDECEIDLLNHILSLLYEFGTLQISRKEFFLMYDKMYRGALSRRILRAFCNRDIPIVNRLRLYAIAAMCPTMFLRHYLSLSLSKIGVIKRLILSKKTSR